MFPYKSILLVHENTGNLFEAFEFEGNLKKMFPWIQRALTFSSHVKMKKKTVIQ